MIRASVFLLLAASVLPAQFNSNARRIQGAAIKSPLACSDTFVLTWVSANNRFECLAGVAGSGAGDALVANPLSQFAATTSLQFKGVISDETGSGAVVFATSPTLVTPALGTPSALVLTNATGLPAASVLAGSLGAGNYTLGGHLLFTDATFDIGASGATRPRDLYLSRDATVGRNLIVNGTVTSGDGTVAGELKMSELTANGSNFRSWLAPDTLTADLQMKFPDTVPSAGDVLTFGAPSSNVSTMTFTSSSGTGNFARVASPTFTGTVVFPSGQALIAPVLGTPTSGTLTNATGLPAAGVVGTAAILGANTFTGIQTYSVNGALSAPGLTAVGTWVTGGSATTTKPYILIETTGATSTGWSTSGTGLGVNAASGFTGNVIDVQVDGTSKFKVTGQFGNATIPGSLTAGSLLGNSLSNTTTNTTLTLNANNYATASRFSVTMATGQHSQTSGTNGALTITPTYNQASGTAANTDLLVNRTETAIGSGAQLLFDFQVAGSSKGKLTNAGIFQPSGGYNSTDGTAGVTGTCAGFPTVKNGLVTGCTGI